MSRIRTVKPELFTDDTLALASIPARYLFVGLFTEADDEGRLLASSKKIAGSLFPHNPRIGSVRVSKWLKELETVGAVVRYRSGDGEYLWIRTFKKHQRISHPTPSRLPAPPENLRNDSGSSLGNIPLELGTRNLEVELGSGTRNLEVVAPEKNSRRDELFEAVAEACGIDWHELTDSERGPLNGAVGQLRAVRATPEQVLYRAGNWPSFFGPDTTLTAPALAKYWSQLRNPKPRVSRTTSAVGAVVRRFEEVENS
jgi:hypothetical protein